MSYPEEVKEKHEANRALLGSFRLPTPKTIAAAELMKELLGEANYNGTMAVSITEFHGHLSDRDLFLVAFSGYHPNLRINRSAASARLSQKLKSDASFWFAEEMDKVYHPMHATTVGFYQKAFGNSFTASTPVTAAMVDTAVDRFPLLFVNPGAYTVMQRNLSKKDKRAPLYGILGSALALRMNLVLQSDVHRVVKKLRDQIALVRTMQQIDAKWCVFFLFVQEMLRANKVAMPGKAAEDDFSSRAPDVSHDADIDGVSKEAVQAWGANALGRYCAEPKAYAAARQIEVSQATGNHLGSIRGQLAFWYSSESRGFSAPLLIIGPEGNTASPGNGGYMAPCTSCRNRSAEMQIGI